jgi:hypothetical protein
VLLAQRFAYAVANDLVIADKLQAQADILRSQALFIDSQSHPSKKITSNPLVYARLNGLYQDYMYTGYGYD